VNNAMGRLRRYTWWSLAVGPALVVVASLADLSSGRYGVVRSIFLVFAVIVVAVQHTRYLRLAMRGVPRDDHRWLEHLATFAVAGGAWAVMAAATPPNGLWSLLPAAVIAHVAVLTTGTARLVVVVGGTATTVVLGGVTNPDTQIADLIPVIFFVGVFVFADLAQMWFWHVVQELDQARDTAEALAIAEERLRFAADLHDIQGHHLQAIALKGELAERLIGRDDEAARKHAAEIAELARTALKETRAVVQGYRRASLGTELTNAVGILQAAGITTTVEGDAGDVPPPLQPLFGALVREGTTNVLRHSSAHRCAVVISVLDGQVRVRLHNDGVRGVSTTEPGAGLAGLRERFAAVGGRIDASATTDGFELSGEVGA
jgi:two-component system sensor histidine kinase DesK